RITATDRHRRPRTRAGTRTAGARRRTPAGPTTGTARRRRTPAATAAVPVQHLGQPALPERRPRPQAALRATADHGPGRRPQPRRRPGLRNEVRPVLARPRRERLRRLETAPARDRIHLALRPRRRQAAP